MPAAVLVVHQLRYELAYGGDAQRALSEQGHAYLSSLTPWLVLVAALALGASLGALMQRWARGGGIAGAAGGEAPGRHGPRLVRVRVWLLASLALLAIYSGQELLEGSLAAGHASGLAALLGGGGWWALPASLAVGGALTLLLRAGAAAEAALAELAPLRLALPRFPRGERRRWAPAAPELAIPAPLARAAAGRAPPRIPVAAGRRALAARPAAAAQTSA